MPARPPVPSCTLPPELRTRLVDIARAALPNEACGYVVGDARFGEAEEPSIVDVVPVPNSLRSPTRFALDGAGMLEAEQRVEDSGRQVVGVFHSHPTSGAVPSVTDRADAAAWDPEGSMLHVIVSMQGFAPTVRAWRLTPDAKSAVEVDLRYPAR